ncbi:hypothetical protein PYCCODRAFT_1441006 [Trametes coccinea BRFM310]|uniref:Uncharacterized protein n=1 Tax=Trametes coccinea (strain BRFM310) TaxID=1353009 RepID=A0A1Y2I811_TRAC3|nr:hypothetical protein PYCCODRAFT_1441006 [Trametes coccinea BRFM310]
MSDSSDSEDSTYQVPVESWAWSDRQVRLTISLLPRQPNPSKSQPTSNCSADAQQPPPPCGCAYLQALHGQIHAGSYATTGGDYLEAIFTHREAFYAYPPAHRGCAVGFSDLARDLEMRELSWGKAWRADWEGDSEAAAAFRHEAWVIANSFS